MPDTGTHAIEIAEDVETIQIEAKNHEKHNSDGPGQESFGAVKMSISIAPMTCASVCMHLHVAW